VFRPDKHFQPTLSLRSNLLSQFISYKENEVL
jgi:hypothetical protein